MLVVAARVWMEGDQQMQPGHHDGGKQAEESEQKESEGRRAARESYGHFPAPSPNPCPRVRAPTTLGQSVPSSLPSLILSTRFVLPAAKKNSVSACGRSGAHIGQTTTFFPRQRVRSHADVGRDRWTQLQSADRHTTGPTAKAYNPQTFRARRGGGHDERGW